MRDEAGKGEQSSGCVQHHVRGGPVPFCGCIRIYCVPICFTAKSMWQTKLALISSISTGVQFNSPGLPLRMKLQVPAFPKNALEVSEDRRAQIDRVYARALSWSPPT